MSRERQPTRRVVRRTSLELRSSDIAYIAHIQERTEAPSETALTRKSYELYSYFIKKADTGESLNIENLELRLMLGIPHSEIEPKEDK